MKDWWVHSTVILLLILRFAVKFHWRRQERLAISHGRVKTEEEKTNARTMVDLWARSEKVWPPHTGPACEAVAGNHLRGSNKNLHIRIDRAIFDTGSTMNRAEFSKPEMPATSM